MILAPAVMGQLSKVKDFVPFYTTVVGGSIVLLAMLFVLSRPGGSKAGRMTKEEWDKMKEEMAKEVEMEEKKGEENEVDEVAVEMKEEKPAEQEEMKEVEVKKEEVKEEVKPAEMKEEVVVTSQYACLLQTTPLVLLVHALRLLDLLLVRVLELHLLLHSLLRGRNRH